MEVASLPLTYVWIPLRKLSLCTQGFGFVALPALCLPPLDLEAHLKRHCCSGDPLKGRAEYSICERFCSSLTLAPVFLPRTMARIFSPSGFLHGLPPSTLPFLNPHRHFFSCLSLQAFPPHHHSPGSSPIDRNPIITQIGVQAIHLIP